MNKIYSDLSNTWQVLSFREKAALIAIISHNVFVLMVSGMRLSLS